MVWQLARPDLLGRLLAAAIGIQAAHHLGGALLLLAAAIGWHGAHAHAAPQGDAPGSG